MVIILNYIHWAFLMSRLRRDKVLFRSQPARQSQHQWRIQETHELAQLKIVMIIIIIIVYNDIYTIYNRTNFPILVSSPGNSHNKKNSGSIYGTCKLSIENLAGNRPTGTRLFMHEVIIMQTSMYDIQTTWYMHYALIITHAQQ